MNNNWNEDDTESEDEEYVEQVCDVLCPHCRQPLQLVLAPAREEEFDEDDEDE